MIVPIKQIIIEGMFDALPEMYKDSDYVPNKNSNWALSDKELDDSLDKTDKFRLSSPKQGFLDKSYIQTKIDLPKHDYEPNHYNEFSRMGKSQIEQLGKANAEKLKDYDTYYYDQNQTNRLKHLDTVNRSYIDADHYMQKQPKGIQMNIMKSIDQGNKILNIPVDKTKSPLYNLMNFETRIKGDNLINH